METKAIEEARKQRRVVGQRSEAALRCGADKFRGGLGNVTRSESGSNESLRVDIYQQTIRKSIARGRSQRGTLHLKGQALVLKLHCIVQVV
jgi:hypothetical protein